MLCVDNANGVQVVERAESFRTQKSTVIFVLQVSTYGRFRFEYAIVYPAVIYPALIYPAVIYIAVIYPAVKYPVVVCPAVIYLTIIYLAVVYTMP